MTMVVVDDDGLVPEQTETPVWARKHRSGSC
jgi:hypothetical protein